MSQLSTELQNDTALSALSTTLGPNAPSPEITPFLNSTPRRLSDVDTKPGQVLKTLDGDFLLVLQPRDRFDHFNDIAFENNALLFFRREGALEFKGYPQIRQNSVAIINEVRYQNEKPGNLFSAIELRDGIPVFDALTFDFQGLHPHKVLHFAEALLRYDKLLESGPQTAASHFMKLHRMTEDLGSIAPTAEKVEGQCIVSFRGAKPSEHLAAYFDFDCSQLPFSSLRDQVVAAFTIVNYFKNAASLFDAACGSSKEPKAD
ncbi:MAG: hypothetical protein KDD62_11790 [Bdellovibrionales bacterium]|nr:hypothetical protein [Bdellovibrionales bacterium]